MPNKNLRPKILELRKKGLTYSEVAEKLSCSRGTVGYHCCSNQKEKYRLRLRKNRLKQHPYVRKTEQFRTEFSSNARPSKRRFYKLEQLINFKIRIFHSMSNKQEAISKTNFTFQDIINKFGETPNCYLTGEPIDIYQPKTYQFDHIIPRSRGGENTLENLGICTRTANLMKSDLTTDELLRYCKKIIKTLES